MNKYDYGVYVIQTAQALALGAIFVATIVGLFLLGRGEFLDALDDVKYWFSQRKLRKQIEKDFATFDHESALSYTRWDVEMAQSLFENVELSKQVRTKLIPAPKNDEFFDKIEEYRNDFSS